MNFLDCTLEETDGRTYACRPHMRVALNPEQVAILSSAQAPKALRMGIRPDDLAIAEGATDAKGEVFIVEPIGGDTLVYMKLPDDVRLLVRTRSGYRAEPGTPCAVTANGQRLHLFAPDTGVAYF
jgi:ABC-type sugar transport system ATPase subunit